MKKILFSLLIAFPLMGSNAFAGNDVVKTGVIVSVNLEDGSGVLRDSETGRLVNFYTRDGEFHLDSQGRFRGIYLNAGTEVSYLSIQDEAKGFSSLIR